MVSGLELGAMSSPHSAGGVTLLPLSLTSVMLSTYMHELGLARTEWTSKHADPYRRGQNLVN